MQNLVDGIKDKVVVITGASSGSFVAASAQNCFEHEDEALGS